MSARTPLASTPADRYPEAAAGGFTRVDGTVAFFTRVQALLSELPEGARVLDYGAGRGQTALNDPLPYRRELQDLRGPGRTVIGIDPDPIVSTNPRVDETMVLPASGRIELPDASIDVIVTDATLEHVDDAELVAGELGRVLKPGGWICARTPNKWGYIAIGARLVPNRLHVKALDTLMPDRDAQDTFPTRYRMNTRRALRRLFPSPRFELHAYTYDGEPYLYAGSSRLLTAAIGALRVLPAPLKSLWMIFIQKEA